LGERCKKINSSNNTWLSFIGTTWKNTSSLYFPMDKWRITCLVTFISPSSLNHYSLYGFGWGMVGSSSFFHHPLSFYVSKSSFIIDDYKNFVVNKSSYKKYFLFVNHSSPYGHCQIFSYHQQVSFHKWKFVFTIVRRGSTSGYKRSRRRGISIRKIIFGIYLSISHHHHPFIWIIESFFSIRRLKHLILLLFSSILGFGEED